MRYIFEPPVAATLPVVGSDALFPVHRLYCVGRNYAAHAREMGHDPDREPPFFFQKNPGCLIADGTFTYPPGAREVHHEIELAVGLKSGGTNIDPAAALDHVFGYAVALDMTRRDLQAELKKQGRPWEVAKAFEGSAPSSPLQPAVRIGHPASGEIRLDVNGSVRQVGDLAQMIWPVSELIASLSRFFTLRAGDVILTGTPDGVGSVAIGDHLAGAIAGVGQLDVTVRA